MEFSNWKIFLKMDHLFMSTLLILMLPVSRSQVESECVLESFPVSANGICEGQIDCYDDLNNIDSKVENWDCIRRVIRDYDSYYGYRNRAHYIDHYDLHVNLFNIKDDTISFSFIKGHVKTLKITNGDLIIVPKIIYDLSAIRDVEITSNKLEKINLIKFSFNAMLKKINVSDNSISVIETEETIVPSNMVTTILDLSHNLLEDLPNYCFSQLAQLQHLNLSYNSMSRFGILTFEGVSQLRSLQISSNKLHEIGHAFIRFISLQELSLDHNRLTDLLEPNFNSISQLERLNVSFNNIENIEDFAFRNLLKLEYLDLSHNRIKKITKNVLKDNRNLHSLSLSDNNINIIEPEAFNGKNIVEFFITNNCIAGAIERETFLGVDIKELNLSGGKINVLGDEAFSTLSSSLLVLNLSSNVIQNISKLAFKSLSNVVELDLSNNDIEDFNFDTNDLKSLSLFYVRNNSIKKITKNMFSYLISLTVLDLSFNSISNVELQSFENLNKLEVLILSKNHLTNNIGPRTFEGLVALTKIEFVNTRVTSFAGEAFLGMTSLSYLNSSFGEISNIEYDAFKNTGAVELLDLSYNLLEEFTVNGTAISQVKKIFLNNNRLTNITNETFAGMCLLQTLNLSDNNIAKIDSNAFHTLVNLVHLYLSTNPEMEISAHIFDNLTSLSEVSLRDVRAKFNFKYATNSSIANLLLPECSITNINTVYVFKISNVNKLDLSSNKIAFIDKFSLQNMSSLTWLDLSFNMITYIQPGSFLGTNMINTINLQENYIPSLPFGVLDGLQNLRVLNLSSNALHSFDVKLLHSTPDVSTIFIDNNVIKYINFHDFIDKKINKLSLGGNPIPCLLLVDLKKSITVSVLNVTAEILNYHSENVDGVTCKSTSVENEIFPAVYNMTSTWAPLAKAVNDLRTAIDSFANKTISNDIEARKILAGVAKKIDDFNSMSRSHVSINEYFKMLIDIYNETQSNIKTDSTSIRELYDFAYKTKSDDTDNRKNLLNIIKALDNFVVSSNKSQNIVDDYLKTLVNINNETNSYMKRIRDETTNKSKYLVINETNESNVNVKNLNDERDLLGADFQKLFRSWQRGGHEKDSSVSKDENINDIKVLLYFIAVCLAVTIVTTLSFFVYNLIKRNVNTLRENVIHRSSQPIANVMEME